MKKDQDKRKLVWGSGWNTVALMTLAQEENGPGFAGLDPK
jgi:hypothetical protein